jgi:BMFP domain-containing protein YqiC
MSKDNKFFEDFVKLAGSAMDTAFNSAAEMKVNFDEMINKKFDSFIQSRNLVTREEFEVVKEMAAKARIEQERLEKKIATLEKKSK